ncbi:glycosyltransferase, partial [Vibrio breoganii]|uniref:glycosyltransferase n=1 Tax=Vibrio breoganii TaxID=553239 RepID=UPI001056B6C3
HNNISVYPSGGVDNEVFRFKNGEEKGLIGYAGRLEKSKNIELLIKVVNENKCLNCEIVGNGSEIEYLKSQVKKLDLTNRVKFLEAKGQIDLADWYGKLDYIAYLSESESLGLVPLEAIVCGALPVLTDIEAFREVQNVLSDVRLCESNVPSVLSLIKEYEALEQKEREKLRIKNSKIVLKNYSSENLKWTLYDIFQSK